MNYIPAANTVFEAVKLILNWEIFTLGWCMHKFDASQFFVQFFERARGSELYKKKAEVDSPPPSCTPERKMRFLRDMQFCLTAHANLKTRAKRRHTPPCMMQPAAAALLPSGWAAGSRASPTGSWPSTGTFRRTGATNATSVSAHSWMQAADSDSLAGLSVFLNFFNNEKCFFAFNIKLIWLGVGFLNSTGAEIGY